VDGDIRTRGGRAEDAALSEQRWEDRDGGIAAAAFTATAAETADAAVAAELGDETRLRADAVRDVAGECVRGETHGVGVYRGERCVRMRVDGSVVRG